MQIEQGNLSHPAILALLEEHLRDMHATSPPESVHALDLSGLQNNRVSFYSLWQQSELLGCGALKALANHSGEIKSMRTARQHLRKGVAARMLQHLIKEAINRGYQSVYLETGSMAYFEPARQLYSKHGFQFCGPFDTYVEDPNSVFMVLRL